MHLVTDTTGPSDELIESVGPVMARRLIDDFKRGRNLRLEKALREQSEVAKDNAAAAHRGVDGMGQVMRRMAPALKYAIIDLYGHEALGDEEFMKRLDRENGLGFKPNYERKAQIVHPGLRS